MSSANMTRRLMTSAAIAVFGVLAALPVRAQIVSRRAVPASVSGTISILWEDNFQAHTARARTMIFDSRTKQTYEVHLDSITVKALGGVTRLGGLRVQMNATPDGRATNVRPTGKAFPTTKPGTPMWTRRRVLVVLCRPSDGLTPFGNVADFKALWFDGPKSVRAFWQESSYGQMDISGDVLDWFTMSGKTADYVKDGSVDLEKFIPECEASIPQSVDLTQYDVVAHELGVGLPVELGGYSDSTTIRGVTKAFGNTITGWKPIPQKDMGDHAHELGHAISLFHTGPMNGNVYASGWDVMSGPNYADASDDIVFGADVMQGEKDVLGFIPVSRRFVATGSSSTITLERNALPNDNANYLVAIVPVTYADSLGQEPYIVELRTHAGFDHQTQSEGVVIHRACNACAQNMTFVVQDRDGNYDANDHGAALQAGDTFEDRANQISVTVESISGSSARVTIRNGRGKVFALPSSGGKKTLVEGGAAVDSIAVTASGPSLGVAWTATNASRNAQWVKVLTPAGNGSGWVRFQRSAAQLAPGTYYDTLKVALTSDPVARLYYDTLVVTAGSAQHLGLSIAARVDSNFAGIGHMDTALVRISGPNAATATWTARRKKSWSFIGSDGITQTPTATGTGNGVVRFSSISSQTTPTGWYVDTITVKLDASPDSAVIYDSLLVVPPVQYTLSSRGRTDSIAFGDPAYFGFAHGTVAVAKVDSVSIAFNDLWATRAAWSVTPGNKPLRFLVPIENGKFANTYSGVGNGKAYFRLVAMDSTKGVSLKPGTYIDTLYVIGPFPTGSTRVPASQPQQLIIDTLVVYQKTTAAGLTLSSAARVDTIALGMNQSIDSVIVTPGGPLADSVRWAVPVVYDQFGHQVTPSGAVSPINVWQSTTVDFGYGGKGRQWLRYQRNTDGRGPGTYVSSIPISTLDNKFTVTLIDTLVILPGTSISLSQAGHADTVAAGATTPVADSTSLFVLGTNASTTAWTASKRKSFTTIATPTGTGSGVLRWTHDVSSLAAGFYVDTITVKAANARGTTIFDTLFVKGGQPSTQIAAAKFDADSVGGVLNYQFSTVLSVNTTPINQSLISYSTLVVWDSTVVQLDSARGVSGGFPAPTVSQSDRAHVSLAATSPAAQSGTVPLARLYFHFSASNVGKQTSITPTFTSAKSPSGADLLAFLVQSSTKAQVIPGAFRGDVNQDGALTSADALILLRSVVGFPGPNGAKLTPNGDANCNGKNEAVDVQYVLAKLVGLPVGTACVGTIK